MDLLTFTIPNRLCAVLALGYLVFAVLLGVSAIDILLNVSCALAILIVAFVMFNLSWIGGGDAKLAAATAIWLGFDHLDDYALSASALGGLLTLSIIGLRKWPLPGVLLARQWATRLHEPGTGIPYGIALASAGLILYPETAIWLGAAAAIH